MSDRAFDILVDDDAYIVRCEGPIRAEQAPRLREQVKPLFPNARKVTLALSQVTQMDSMGLGTLVRLYVSARSAGCELELINLGKRIRQLLGMTNLLGVFSICGEQGMRMP